MKTHYETLGVPENAPAGRIKEAYKRLAIRYHPDKNPNNPSAEEVFKQINGAYQILSDPYKRSLYDSRLESMRTAPETYQQAQAEAEARYRAYAYRYQYGVDPYPIEQRIRDNFWGVIITFAIFTVIFIIAGIMKYQNIRMKEAELARKAEQRDFYFGRISSLLANDSLLEAYQIINFDLKPEINNSKKLSEDDKDYLNRIMYEYEHYFQNRLRKVAADAFEEKNYPKSIQLYQLAIELDEVDSTLAAFQVMKAYMQIGEYDNAKKYLNMWDTLSGEKVSYWHFMAKIAEKKGESDLIVADYFDKAAKASADYYAIYYGKAYQTFLNPDMIPESHYQMSLDHTNFLIKQRELTKADNLSKWLLNIRPQYAPPFLVKGQILRLQGRLGQACRYWQVAQKLGSKEATDHLNRYCGN